MPQLKIIVVVVGWLCMLAPVRGQPLSQEVRIKDISSIEGERINQLSGVGLVVGLAGTGGKTPQTRIFAANLLQHMGQRINPLLREAIANDTQQKTDSLSVVYVQAEIPITARPGQRIDAIVSTFDDAESLRGGTLVTTPLFGHDENVYAVAAGTISVAGAFNFGGDAATVQKGHPTVGRLPKQVVVEKAVPIKQHDFTSIRLLLDEPDWNTAGRIADAINLVAPDKALVEDSGSVFVRTPVTQVERANFVRLINSVTVAPDARAKVVINERSGTLVFGGHVKLSQVAISHGSISVTTGETPVVSQPAPFSDGATTVVPRTEVNVVEERGPIAVLDAPATVGDLAAGLEALGASSSDLSEILQQLKASGALHADIVFR